MTINLTEIKTWLGPEPMLASAEAYSVRIVRALVVEIETLKEYLDTLKEQYDKVYDDRERLKGYLDTRSLERDFLASEVERLRGELVEASAEIVQGVAEVERLETSNERLRHEAADAHRYPEVERLTTALQALTKGYAGLIASGDCGPKIDPETDPLVIQAHAAMRGDTRR